MAASSPRPPAGLAPMLAVPGRLPAEDVDDSEWAYEVKWDGMRVLVTVDDTALSLTSRLGNDVTSSFPELAVAPGLAGRGAVLDGEVVSWDPQGRSDFGRLQARLHVANPPPTLQALVPVTLVLFDLLWLDGESLLPASYDDRRAALSGLPVAADAWRVPEHFVGEGHTVARTTRAQGLEGVVAKRRTSRYEPGRRSENWRKIKHLSHQSAVVVGWRAGRGSRQASIGSLLLAVHGDTGLDYVGQVGTGFSGQTLRLLTTVLDPLRTAQCPLGEPLAETAARGAVWVRPVLVVEVEYASWTHQGRLRHPCFTGLRPDLDATTVSRP